MKKLTALLLALTMPLLANAASEPNIDPEVKQYVDEKFYAAMPDRQELIDVDSTGYAALNDGFTTVSVAIEEIKPHANGSEITLRIVNWMGVTLTDIGFEVAAVKPKESYNLYKTVSLSEAKPGKAAYLKVRLPAKTSEFSEVDIIYKGATGIRYSNPN